MDDLIEELFELWQGYAEAKAELKECRDNCDFDAAYFCQQYSQDVDEYKENIKATIKKIVDINKGE